MIDAKRDDVPFSHIQISNRSRPAQRASTPPTRDQSRNQLEIAGLESDTGTKKIRAAHARRNNKYKNVPPPESP